MNILSSSLVVCKGTLLLHIFNGFDKWGGIELTQAAPTIMFDFEQKPVKICLISANISFDFSTHLIIFFSTIDDSSKFGYVFYSAKQSDDEPPRINSF